MVCKALGALCTLWDLNIVTIPGSQVIQEIQGIRTWTAVLPRDTLDHRKRYTLKLVMSKSHHFITDLCSSLTLLHLHSHNVLAKQWQNILAVGWAWGLSILRVMGSCQGSPRDDSAIFGWDAHSLWGNVQTVRITRWQVYFQDWYFMSRYAWCLESVTSSVFLDQ